MKMLINPLFVKKNEKNFKVLAELSPVSKEEMVRTNIKTIDGKEIPCYVCLSDRVCLPVKKEIV